MSNTAHTSAPRRRPRALARALTVAVLAAVAVLGAAAPASAHDRLISSDPADGDALTALPEQVTLTFSAAVLPDAGATVVEVATADGTRLDDGEPVVDGATVTQALGGEIAGTAEVTVTWKVVSSDGHPISGAFAFTTDGAEPEPTPTETASAEPTEEPTPTATTFPGPPMEASPGIPPFVWAIIGVLGAGLAGALLYVAVARLRAQSDGGQGSQGD